ncbi:hypothetical protein [Falsiroseomonas sp. CW058]|uniref:hypothetical protein n=1 Tax=Falsiroseomonas sp. CW058 TaxID=3388664 RepID=UPI003D31C5DA
MSDSAASPVSIAVTPMHRTEEGQWESGPREGANFFLVEVVQGDGEDAEIVVECRDERAAALSARVAAATVAALGMATPGPDGAEVVPAFDEQTAAILAENPTPEVELAAGEWREEDEDEDEEDEPGEGAPGRA